MIFNIFVIVKIFIGILLIIFLFDMDFGFFKNWIFLFFVVLLRLIYLCKYFLSLEYVLIFVVVLKIIGRSKIVLLDNLNGIKGNLDLLIYESCIYKWGKRYIFCDCGII